MVPHPSPCLPRVIMWTVNAHMAEKDDCASGRDEPSDFLRDAGCGRILWICSGCIADGRLPLEGFLRLLEKKLVGERILDMLCHPGLRVKEAGSCTPVFEYLRSRFEYYMRIRRSGV